MILQSDAYDVIQDYELILTGKITDSVTRMLPSVGLLAGVIATVFIGYKVMKSFLGENERLDTSTLVRPILTLAAIVLYVPLIDLLLERPVDLINRIVMHGVGFNPADLPMVWQNVRDNLTHTQDTGGSDGGGIFDILQLNPVFEIFHIIVFFAATVAGAYILMRQLIIKSIYIMLGPFALALSLIPSNEKVLSSWYQGYFSVLLWVPVLTILQAIIIELPLSTQEYNAPDIIFSLVIQLLMVIAVLKIPQYANMLVSQGTNMGQRYGATIKSKMMESKAKNDNSKNRNPS